ncbi:MAG: diguanylate cyclase [Acidimicrobiales bacterium]
MVTKLADYWFGVYGKTDRAAPARGELVAAAEQFDRSMAMLEGSNDPAVARTAARIAATKPGTPFDRAIDDAVAGRPPGPFRDGVDAALIGSTFSSSFDLFMPLLDVMSQRAARLEASAARRADAATRSAVITLVAVLAAIAVMLALSSRLAASVERPLARLIEGTRRVGHGDLEVEPLPADGPAEIGAASAAFNVVAANLRLLEGKVDALANADFDDPRLAQPLPGALGDAMAERIGVLSASMIERATLQEQLAYEASHDALTGIHNRGAAIEAIDAAMARARRHRTPLAVAFLDLDGFKQVNDAHGHQAGDDVLRETARRISDVARAGDFCARFGGDEFLIVAEQVAGDDGGLALGHRVAAAIDRPISLGTFTVQVGASVGVALLDPTDQTPLELLARADLAAYHAKRTGGGVELYTDALRA